MEGMTQPLYQDDTLTRDSASYINTSSGTLHTVVLDDLDVRQFMNAGGTQYETELSRVIGSFSPYYPITNILQQFYSGQRSNSYYQQFVPPGQNLNKYIDTVNNLLSKHCVRRAYNGFPRKNGTMTKSTQDLGVHIDLLNSAITYDVENNISPLATSDFEKQAALQQKLMDICVQLTELIQKDATKQATLRKIVELRTEQQQIDDLRSQIEMYQHEIATTECEIQYYALSADQIDHEVQRCKETTRTLKTEALKIDNAYKNFACKPNNSDSQINAKLDAIRRQNQDNNRKLQRLKQVSVSKSGDKDLLTGKEHLVKKLEVYKARVGQLETLQGNAFDEYLLNQLINKASDLHGVLRECAFQDSRDNEIAYISCKSTCKDVIEIANCDLQRSYCGNVYINQLIVILQLCTSVCSMTVAGPLLGYFIGLRHDDVEVRNTNGTFLSGNVFSEPAIELITQLLDQESELEFYDEDDEIEQDTDLILLNAIANMTSISSEGICDYNHNYVIKLDDNRIKLSNLCGNPILYQRYRSGLSLYIRYDDMFKYIDLCDEYVQDSHCNYQGSQLHLRGVGEIYKNNTHAFAVPVKFPAGQDKKVLDAMMQVEDAKEEYKDIGHVGLETLSKELSDYINKSTSTMRECRDTDKCSQWEYGGLQRFITPTTIREAARRRTAVTEEQTKRLFNLINAIIQFRKGKSDRSAQLSDLVYKARVAILNNCGIELPEMPDQDFDDHLQKAIDTMSDPFTAIKKQVYLPKCPAYSQRLEEVSYIVSDEIEFKALEQVVEEEKVSVSNHTSNNCGIKLETGPVKQNIVPADPNVQYIQKELESAFTNLCAVRNSKNKGLACKVHAQYSGLLAKVSEYPDHTFRISNGKDFKTRTKVQASNLVTKYIEELAKIFQT